MGPALHSIFVGQSPRALLGVRGKESLSHGFAVPAPFGQGGARGRGRRIATASVRTGFAMTGSFTWGAVDARAGRPGGRPLRKCRNTCVGRRALTPP